MFARIALRVARIPLIRSPFCWPAAPLADMRVVCVRRALSRKPAHRQVVRRAHRQAALPGLIDTAMRRISDASSGEWAEGSAGA